MRFAFLFIANTAFEDVFTIKNNIDTRITVKNVNVISKDLRTLSKISAFSILIHHLRSYKM